MLQVRAYARLGCVLVALAGLVTAAPPAYADTAEQAAARAQAAQLLDRVRVVQQQVGAATTAYDRALAGVTAAVSAQLLADQEVTDRRRAADEAQQRIDTRARMLYMNGGPVAFYASLLTADDLADAAGGAELVGRVLATDRASAAALDAAVTPARRRAHGAAAAVTAGLRTERTVANVARRLEDLLTEQRTLLAAARGRVRHLDALAAERARLAAALAAQQAAAAAVTTSRIGVAQATVPPSAYRQLYHAAAATCPGLSWTVLAAIGQVESGHGANPSTSSAGAMGPMQFLPATFVRYGADGDGDGVADIMNPADAIHSAANYLCANGAGRGPAGLARAIWHYNHADWYVQLVQRLSSQYATQPS